MVGAPLRFSTTIGFREPEQSYGGGSGLDRRYEELAFEYAFILDLVAEESR